MKILHRTKTIRINSLQNFAVTNRIHPNKRNSNSYDKNMVGYSEFNHDTLSYSLNHISLNTSFGSHFKNLFDSIEQRRIEHNRKLTQNILKPDSSEVLESLKPLFKSKNYGDLIVTGNISAEILKKWASLPEEHINKISGLFDCANFCRLAYEYQTRTLFRDILYSINFLPENECQDVYSLVNSVVWDNKELLEIYSNHYSECAKGDISRVLNSEVFDRLFGCQVSLLLYNFLKTAQQLSSDKMKILANCYEEYDCTKITKKNSSMTAENFLEFGYSLQNVSDSHVASLSLMQKSGCNMELLSNFMDIMKKAEEEVDISNGSYSEKIKLMSEVTSLKALTDADSIFSEDELLKINKMEAETLKSLSQIISVQHPASSEVKAMANGFFANNDPQLENTIKSFDFAKYEKRGLPLKYTRMQFLKDLGAILNSLPKDQQNDILSKLDIRLTKDSTGNIIGYDGIINLSKLARKKIEGRIYDIANEFINENAVRTDSEELNKALNSLIHGMPEFINIIGKKPDDNPALEFKHSYSLDIHTLIVLQEAMKNTKYNDLSAQDKTVLKFACILHDIAKNEGVADPDHPERSSLYAANILDKYKYVSKMKLRIVELVRNHHWFAKVCNNRISPKQAALLFRRENDFLVARILAEADIKGVSNDFYNCLSPKLNDSRIFDEIESQIDRIYQTGQIMYSTPIINRELIPEIIYNKKKYKVIDLNSIPNDQDLGEFGFEKGTIKGNLRFLVHMASPEDLESSLFNKEGLECASYISPESCSTFFNKRYGIAVTAEQVNIANVSKTNQVSGSRKSMDDFGTIVDGGQKDRCDYRREYAITLMKEFGINPDEYKELFILLSRYTTVSEFIHDNKDKSFAIGNKTYSAFEIAKKVTKVNDSILSKNKNNEINIHAPNVYAFIAKANSLYSIPLAYMNIIEKYDLPIILLGFDN